MADSCSYRLRVTPGPSSDYEADAGQREHTGGPRDQDVARARHFGWSWLTLLQPGEKLERVMGIEPT